MEQLYTITTDHVVLRGVVILEDTSEGVWVQYADEPDEPPMFFHREEVRSVEPS
jgi:hypothetical protein